MGRDERRVRVLLHEGRLDAWLQDGCSEEKRREKENQTKISNRFQLFSKPKVKNYKSDSFKSEHDVGL